MSENFNDTSLPSIPNLSNSPNRHVRFRSRPFKNVNTRRYKCIKGCPHSFITLLARRVHYQTVHEGKSYSCPWPECPAVFRSFLCRKKHYHEAHVLPRLADRIEDCFAFQDI